jgi:hypothetical protein
MTDEEVSEILKNIIDLARCIGWNSALVQDKDSVILGLYLGQESWINYKVANTDKVKH